MRLPKKDNDKNSKTYILFTEKKMLCFPKGLEEKRIKMVELILTQPRA